MRIFWFIFLLFFICFITFGEQEDGLIVGSNAPIWTLAGVDGNIHSLADFRGKVVILDFWATWCDPCIKGMPAMQAIYKDYNNDVAVIGLTYCDDPEDAKEFFKTEGYNYILLFGAEVLTEKYNIEGIPSVFILDKEGKILHYNAGWGEGLDNEYRKILDSYLK